MINDKQKEDIALLIKQAGYDLDEFYSKIKKSKKFLKFKDNGVLLSEMNLYVLSQFVVMNIVEMSSKSKMIHNGSKRELNRKERFKFMIQIYEEKFEFVVKQYEEYLEKEND